MEFFVRFQNLPFVNCMLLSSALDTGDTEDTGDTRDTKDTEVTENTGDTRDTEDTASQYTTIYFENSY